MLHAADGRPSISDPHFLLTAGNFSLAREMDATILALWSGDGHAVCRFPARYFWLRSRLQAPALDIGTCSDLREFLTKAPADGMSLVFASDNISQPASMMGHTFLKFSGHTADGRKSQHAISFFTTTDTINYPKLFFDSLVVGLPGIFALAPYEEVLSRYVDEEQRTVWEFELELDAEQRTLIQYHLIELKQTQLTYYFQSYNCATLVNYVLSLADPGIRPHMLWTTPRDVVKNAASAGIIHSAVVISPARWRLRQITELLGGSQMRQLAAAVEHAVPDAPMTVTATDTDFLRLEGMRAINDYEHRDGKIAEDTWRHNKDALLRIREQQFAGKALTASEWEDPRKSPDEIQIGILGAHYPGHDYAGVTFLPVSHTLADDNRNGPAENQLMLLRTSLMVEPRGGHVKLDRLDIYSIESLLPRDPVSGGLSGRFAVAIEPQWDGALQEHKVFSLGGAAGFTVRPVPDIDLYALAGGALAYGAGHAYAAPDAEAGAIIREIGGMKTLLSVHRYVDQIHYGTAYSDVEIRHSLWFGRAFAVQLQADLLRNAGASIRTARLEAKYLF